MKLLIVDDSDVLQTRLKKSILEVDNSIIIEQAYSVKQATSLFISFIPCKIILDISLRDGSGIDLLLKFKTEKPDTEIIILTNFSSPEFKKRCMNLGADYFFDKSNLSGLLRVIA
jgi:DNA-binding NarL/FixJ family response regulator